MQLKFRLGFIYEVNGRSVKSKIGLEAFPVSGLGKAGKNLISGYPARIPGFIGAAERASFVVANEIQHHLGGDDPYTTVAGICFGIG